MQKGKQSFLLFVIGIILVINFSKLYASAYEEFSAKPTLQNNFAEASFRLWLPKTSKPLDGVIVVLHGTDSDARPLTSDLKWQGLATKINYGLIGCYYRGEGESYDMAEGGSGQALLDALERFSKQTGRTELAKTSIIIWGVSAGGQFANRFACWKPERVRAFITIKWGSLASSIPDQTYRVPALIIAGEHDEVGRNSCLANLFKQGRERAAPWCFLLEKNSGHDLGQSEVFSMQYIQDLVSGGYTVPYAADLTKYKLVKKASTESNSPMMGWLPSERNARFWEKLHRACQLDQLINATVPPMKISRIVYGNNDFNWGRVFTDKRFFEKTLVTEIREAIPSERLRLITKNKRMRIESTARFGEMKSKIIFDTQGLELGPYRSDLTFELVSGQLVVESETVTLYALISANVVAQPTSLYVGGLGQNKKRSFKLKISAPAHSLTWISASSSEPDWIKPVLKKQTEHTLEFDCIVDAGERIGRRFGQLRFRVKTDQERTIVVPYIGFVSKGEKN